MCILVTAPDVRVGDPKQHRALAVLPLFVDEPHPVTYRLSLDALKDGTIEVTEVGEEGSVPDLLARNHGKTRVLFLEGEELVGAKQDRVVNTSVLVPPGARIHLPVSCVEHGRWVYRSNRVMMSGAHSPTIVRSALKSSVSMSLDEDLDAVANQAHVWDSIAKLHKSYGVASPTGAMSDAYARYEEQLAEFRAALAYVPRAAGVALAAGDRLLALDVFDKASTCRKVWDRLLSGAVFDALASQDAACRVGPWDVKCWLNTAGESVWRPVRTIGDGTEFRATVDGDPASMLVCEEVTVHQSIVAA